MKKTIIIIFGLLLTVGLSAQDIQGFVSQQLKTYPKSRLLDLYKSCFQDYMGAEHLVSDRENVKAYLDEELQSVGMNDLPSWYYEPCGVDGRYVRVSLRTIKENMISEDLLLDAFVRSANSENRPSVEAWRDRWHMIIGAIDQMNLNLPNYQEDRAFIDSILSAGKYAISHSPEYREAYNPHYRIVERGIFERELKPLIKPRSQTPLKRVYNEEINPFEQIDQAVQKAQSEGKFVICQVGGNWCPWCLRFADFIEKDSTISQVIEDNFVYIHVNYNPSKTLGEEKVEQAKALMKRLNNPERFGFPVFVVLDETGKVLHLQDSSFLEEGMGYNQEKVLRFFQCWTPQAVKENK